MCDPVGSTSWHHRHAAVFSALNELLVAGGETDNPVVLVIGPGAVTRWAAALLNDAARPERSRARKLIGDLARYADQVLRRIPFLQLRSLEPVELRQALGVPHRMVVADRSRRVLDAVRRDLPDVECHIVDIAREAPPVIADVVIAFNVIGRLDDPPAGMRRLAAAVRPGGLLLIDDRSARAYLGMCGKFQEAAPKIHRRAATDAR